MENNENTMAMSCNSIEKALELQPNYFWYWTQNKVVIDENDINYIVEIYQFSDGSIRINLTDMCDFDTNILFTKETDNPLYQKTMEIFYNWQPDMKIMELSKEKYNELKIDEQSFMKLGFE